MKYQSKKEGIDQESIHSSTTPDPGYQWESEKFTLQPLFGLLNQQNWNKMLSLAI